MLYISYNVEIISYITYSNSNNNFLITEDINEIPVRTTRSQTKNKTRKIVPSKLFSQFLINCSYIIRFANSVLKTIYVNPENSFWIWAIWLFFFHYTFISWGV